MIDTFIILGAIIAFTATNIDDLFMLILFFGNKNFKRSHVVAGQYLGIFSLITISSVGYFFKFIIPHQLIALLGILPIAIGTKELKNFTNPQKVEKKVSYQDNTDNISSITQIAAITFSNGGDNIGIYMPLFASVSINELIQTIIIFALMIGLWCFIAFKMVNHKLFKNKIEKYAHIIFPFVLIAIGLFILIKNI